MTILGAISEPFRRIPNVARRSMYLSRYNHHLWHGINS